MATHGNPTTEIAGRAVRDAVEESIRRGRGARTNISGRFEAEQRDAFDDGWDGLANQSPFKTEVRLERARSIITTNDSPDISFDKSINPYRGCEHGCIYCYARPTHGFLGHSSGLDFETRLYGKSNAADVLEKEFANPGYRPSTIALGTATDPYQPIEKRYEITRRILEVLEAARHPVGIVTKSTLVVRDIDILQRMAKLDLVKVAISVTTLERDLARRMEPRASTPARRLAAIRQLTEAGIPAHVMVAPIIPGLNDHEIEPILEAAADAGARAAGYVLLRLPLELKDLFREWLATEYPERANKILHLVQSMHGGSDYRSDFGLRQTGSGPYARLISARFRLALKRLRLNERRLALRTDLFVRPVLAGQQMSLL